MLTTALVLGALLVARTGRRACPDLDMLLDGWDGELTPADRRQIDRHVDQCDICADRVDSDRSMSSE